MTNFSVQQLPKIYGVLPLTTVQENSFQNFIVGRIIMSLAELP